MDFFSWSTYFYLSLGALIFRKIQGVINMTELQILTAVKNNDGHIEFTQLLSLNLSEEDRDPLADKDLINRLIAADILSGKTKAFSKISFGENGRLRLRELKQLEKMEQQVSDESAQQKTSEKAEKRKERAFQIRLSLYGAIFGCLISNIDRLINWVITLF